MSAKIITNADELAPVVVPLRAPRRWNIGAIVSALVAVICALGLLTVVNRYAATQEYLVLTHDLPAGAVLTPDDLRPERGRLSPSTYSAVVSGTERASVIGHRLTVSVFAGVPLARGQLAEGSGLRPGYVAMAIPVKSENAVGGRLRQGDRVRVIATWNKGKTESRTTVLTEAATVQAVGRERRLGTSSGSAVDQTPTDAAITWLTLLIGEDTALELGAARWNADLDIVLLPSQP